MQWLTDMPLRGKLLLITALSCVIVLLLAGSMIAAYQFSSYRTQKILEAEAQAQILAASAASSLVFDDAKATQDYLNALKADDQITAAAIYKGDGLFAGYAPVAQGGRPLPAHLEFGATHFDGYELQAYAPVREGAHQIGFVYLRVATESLGANLMRNGAIILAVMFGSLLLMLPLSLRMHTTIANPIREIAEAAKLVAAGEIAALEIHGRRNDEIGMLEQQFNRMALSLQNQAALAKRISNGDLSVHVTPQSERDVLGNAFVAMTQDLREKAELAAQIADGNLTAEVKPRGEQDMLGNAFAAMA
ncbi:MAG: HAMP domain-containing protein, partial [Burkholderiaceae bacterium]|nr:HAMP domain-containing protein [Burkholderiaceae bacterium]